MVVIQDHGHAWLLQSELPSAAMFSLGGEGGVLFIIHWGRVAVNQEGREMLPSTDSNVRAYQ